MCEAFLCCPHVGKDHRPVICWLEWPGRLKCRAIGLDASLSFLSSSRRCSRQCYLLHDAHLMPCMQKELHWQNREETRRPIPWTPARRRKRTQKSTYISFTSQVNLNMSTWHMIITSTQSKIWSSQNYSKILSGSIEWELALPTISWGFFLVDERVLSTIVGGDVVVVGLKWYIQTPWQLSIIKDIKYLSQKESTHAALEKMSFTQTHMFIFACKTQCLTLWDR